MAAISKPDTTVNIVAKREPTANSPQKILLIGQQLSSGTATSGVLKTNILSTNEADGLFGRASMLAYMIREAKKINVVTRIDAIPLDDHPSATAATATIEFSGTVTELSTVNLVIFSKTNYLFQVAVDPGDFASTVATKLATAINGDNSIPVSAGTAAEILTLTAKNLGFFGNTFALRMESLPPGITLATFDGFAGGNLEPETQAIFEQIADIRYQTIAYPQTFDIETDLVPFMNQRFNVDNAVLDGVVFIGQQGSAQTIQSLAEAIDSESFVLLGNKLVSISGSYEGTALLENGVGVSSQLAAIRALRLTPGQNIVNFLVGGNIFTAQGGPSRAALPYHNTPMENLPTIEEELGWTSIEQNDLNNNGVSFVGNNTTVNSIIMGDMVTTYLTSAQDVSDTTFKFLNAVDTASNVREYFFNNNKTNYAQSTLTQGELVNGASMVTQSTFEAFQDSLYTDLGQQPFALVPKGTEATTFFADNLNVTIDFESGAISFVADTPIVSQVRKISGTIRISFTLQQGGSSNG